MFGIMELPRKDGAVDGDFHAKHSSGTFTLEGWGYKFVDGITLEPVRGTAADRLFVAYGSDISFVPVDRVTGLNAIGCMVERNHPQAIVEQRCNELDALFPEPKELEVVVDDDSDEEPLPPIEADADGVTRGELRESEPKKGKRSK